MGDYHPFFMSFWVYYRFYFTLYKTTIQNMKKSIFALAFLLAGTVAFSQAGLTLGIKAGPNFADLSTPDGLTTDAITSFHGGAYAKVKVLMFSLQPELLWSSQGADLSALGQKGEINFNYVNVPVMLLFNLPLGLNLQVGPQFSFLTSAENLNGDDIKDSFKDSDLSLGLGAGWSFKKINVTGRYLIGLSDISEDPDVSGSIKNNVFQVSLGLDLFSLGN